MNLFNANIDFYLQNIHENQKCENKDMMRKFLSYFTSFFVKKSFNVVYLFLFLSATSYQ